MGIFNVSRNSEYASDICNYVYVLLITNASILTPMHGIKKYGHDQAKLNDR